MWSPLTKTRAGFENEIASKLLPVFSLVWGVFVVLFLSALLVKPIKTGLKAVSDVILELWNNSCLDITEYM